MEHFRRVEQLAVYLAGREPRFERLEKNWLLLQLSALAHDVVDHKYVREAEAPRLREHMLRCMTVDCGLDPREARCVQLVAENVSLSRELQGRLALTELEREGCLLLRHLVSDADKLDALGEQGLRRMLQYNAERYGALLPDEAAVGAQLREDAERHLFHRVDYLHTAAAQELARVRLADMKALLADAARLSELLGQELRPEMASTPVERVLEAARRVAALAPELNAGTHADVALDGAALERHLAAARRTVAAADTLRRRLEQYDAEAAHAAGSG